LVLDERQTLILAIIVLFLGRFLNKRISFLKEYNIPEPVTGGVLASLIFASIYFFANITISFTLETRDILLIVFFTTIGLSSKLSTLLEGGKLLLILLIIAIVYLFIQNFTGIAIATSTGLDSTVGVLSGSVSLSGGHGTTIAWAPIFKDTYNINNAMEIGIACATFGLVLGGVVGGPIAKYLINKNNLKPAFPKDDMVVGIKDTSRKKISVDSMLGVFLIISLAV
jgi:ESS family glutamate:Na+ symporter